ncbi:hypothetical protein [Sphaerimonospora mesophila]|uniref:hypothetical protein n=1 Tax=Sphaerimonospora mesophila TaxID=37483 RepID=UPI0006E45852
MSKRVILALASAAVLSAVLPGMAGYVTAQFQALDRAHEELSRLRAQLRMMELTVEPASAECPDRPSTGRRQEENGMQVPTPPRTDSRPWQDAAYEQPAEAPTTWTSLVGPSLVARPAPQRPPSRRRGGPGCPVAGAYLAQLGFGASSDSNCRER